jgi:hypothetical protein
LPKFKQWWQFSVASTPAQCLEESSKTLPKFTYAATFSAFTEAQNAKLSATLISSLRVNATIKRGLQWQY